MAQGPQVWAQAQGSRVSLARDMDRLDRVESSGTWECIHLPSRVQAQVVYSHRHHQTGGMDTFPYFRVRPRSLHNCDTIFRLENKAKPRQALMPVSRPSHPGRSRAQQSGGQMSSLPRSLLTPGHLPWSPKGPAVHTLPVPTPLHPPAPLRRHQRVCTC